MIPNFHEVIAGKVYRSGQPYLLSHWQELQTRDIKTIVKLDYPDEGNDCGATYLNMHVLDFGMPPCSLWQAFFGAPDSPFALRAAMELCDEANWPVLVHCLHGQDRTGLIVAMFRVLKQGWPIEQARGEMLAMGFHVELIDLDRVWHQFVESRKGA